MSPIPPLPPCGSGGGTVIEGEGIDGRPAAGDVAPGTVYIDSVGETFYVSDGIGTWIIGGGGSGSGGFEFGQSMRLQEGMADMDPRFYGHVGALSSADPSMVVFNSATDLHMTVPFEYDTIDDTSHRLDVQAVARSGVPSLAFGAPLKPGQNMMIQTTVYWVSRGNDRESGPYSGNAEMSRMAVMMITSDQWAAWAPFGNMPGPEAMSAIVDWVSAADGVVNYTAGAVVTVYFLTPDGGNPFVGDPDLGTVAFNVGFGSSAGSDAARIDVRGFAQQFSNAVPPLQAWDY